MLPKVAIICANYNYGHFILDGMESIINQTYEGEIRLYVVDDGSSDESWEIISRYATSKDNVFVQRIENSGASVARNTAIKMCWDWADVIGVLDADDSYKPTKVEKLVNKLIEHPEIGVAYGDYDIHRSYGSKHYVKYESKASYCRRRLTSDCMVHSNALIKKEYLQKKDNYKDDSSTTRTHIEWTFYDEFLEQKNIETKKHKKYANITDEMIFSDLFVAVTTAMDTVGKG